jgi:hypothetical protein
VFLPDCENTSRRRESAANHFFISYGDGRWINFRFQEIPETYESIIGDGGCLPSISSVSHASHPRSISTRSENGSWWWILMAQFPQFFPYISNKKESELNCQYFKMIIISFLPV